MPPESLNPEINVLVAHFVILLHVFNCLNAKGVLPFAEAAESLKSTLESLDAMPNQTKQTIAQMIDALEGLAAKAEVIDPTKTPPPTRLH